MTFCTYKAIHGLAVFANVEAVRLPIFLPTTSNLCAVVRSHLLPVQWSPRRQARNSNARDTRNIRRGGRTRSFLVRQSYPASRRFEVHTYERLAMGSLRTGSARVSL